MNLLEVKSLSKSFRSHWTYRSRRAVESVGFTLERGEILGLVGHNGAGKTTTIKCILGLISSDSGEINLGGRRLTEPEQRAEIGYLPELPYFYENLTVEQTLVLYGELCGLYGEVLEKRIDALLQQFSLEDRKHSRISALSKGLKQRVGFAQSIINNPSLLILDEPFSGLDPMARHEFKDIIKELRDNGTSILLCSHVLADVEELCSRVIILARGEVKREVNIAELHRMGRNSFELTLAVAELSKQQLDSFNPDSIEYLPARAILHFTSEKIAQAALKKAAESGITIIGFTSKAPTLEELFIETSTEHAKDSDNRPLHVP